MVFLLFGYCGYFPIGVVGSCSEILVLLSSSKMTTLHDQMYSVDTGLAYEFFAHVAEFMLELANEVSNRDSLNTNASTD